MIKRNDLAKQFELVVKQEIKNHNDLMLANNIAMEHLRNEMIRQKRSRENEIKELHQEISQLKLDLHEAKFKSTVDSCSLRSHINDSSVNKEKVDNEFGKILDSVKQLQEHLSRHDQILLNSLSRDSEINDKFTRLSKELSHEFIEKNKKLLSDINSMVEEVKNKPSEADALEKKIEKQLVSHKIDCDGVYQELRVLRRDFDYANKKIENIYTLIERLQKKVN